MRPTSIGFRSDPIARALRGGSTGVVGVIGGSLADHWHQEFASELQRHLRRRGRHMLLADADGDAGTELDRARALADQRVDGLIALPVAPESPEWAEIVAELPVVAVGAPLPQPASAVRFQAAADAMSCRVRFRWSTSGHSAFRRNGALSSPTTSQVVHGAISKSSRSAE